MGKPTLAVHERSAQEGVHRVSFNVVPFTSREILGPKSKLGVVPRSLKLSSIGYTIHCPVMDHSIAENPETMGDAQDV